MKTKPLTFLLSLTFLFLFSGSVYGDDFQDGLDAYDRGDYKEAVGSWLSLEKGDARVQLHFGVMYFEGKGVPQDYKKAEEWFRLSAEQGNAEAQVLLGTMYASGRGVPQDYKEAVKWYRLSAEQGQAYAQYNLGNKYKLGQGVPQDYASAHMWWNICGSGGNKKQNHACVEQRDIIEKRMSPQQIEKAQRLARNWKPKK